MISVITRTKNRNLFLSRVYKALKRQNYRPIEWIVVNDAGSSATELIHDFQKDADKDFIIKYIEKETSTTMESATNVGLKVLDGNYIHILDDDDTISEGFYADAIAHLENLHIDSIGGIICYSAYVYEQVGKKNQIQHIRTEDFPLKPSNITIPAMLRENQFPIHAFIYKKTTLEKVGYYDESLPVLGDWDFNLRFLQYYDIAVLPKQYAFYHKRVNNKYANSVQTDLSLFFMYEAIIKNKLIRKNYKKSLPLLLGQSENTKLVLDLYQNDIVKKNREVSDTHAKIAQIETTIHEKNLVISSLTEDKKNILDSLDKLLKDKDNHIVNIEQILKLKEEELNQRNNEYVQLQTQKKELEEHYDIKVQDIENLNANIDEIVEDLATIKESKCWIYTKPLRDLKKLIKD